MVVRRSIKKLIHYFFQFALYTPRVDHQRTQTWEWKGRCEGFGGKYQSSQRNFTSFPLALALSLSFLPNIFRIRMNSTPCYRFSWKQERERERLVFGWSTSSSTIHRESWRCCDFPVGRCACSRWKTYILSLSAYQTESHKMGKIIIIIIFHHQHRLPRGTFWLTVFFSPFPLFAPHTPIAKHGEVHSWSNSVHVQWESLVLLSSSFERLENVFDCRPVSLFLISTESTWKLS